MSIYTSQSCLKLYRHVLTELARKCLVAQSRNVSQFNKPVSFGAKWSTGSGQNLRLNSNHYPSALRCGEFLNKGQQVGFHTSSANCHGEYEWQDPKSEDEVVTVQFLDKDGKAYTIKGKIGDNLLYLAKRFEVEMEGACEASLACTTCHTYVDHDFLDLLPEATETEEDLLDQAPFLKENSRLGIGTLLPRIDYKSCLSEPNHSFANSDWGCFPGCQIILNKQLDGLKCTLPAVTKNFYVDGHKPTPH